MRTRMILACIDWDGVIRKWTQRDWHGSPGFARFLLDIHRVPGRTFVMNSTDDIRLATHDDLPDWAEDDFAFQLPADRRAQTIGSAYSITVIEAASFVGLAVGWEGDETVGREWLVWLAR